MTQVFCRKSRRAFNLIAGGISAAIGGFVGGAISIGVQYYSTGTVDLQIAGAEALGGVVAGGLVGLTMGASLSTSTFTGSAIRGALSGGPSTTVGGMVTRAVDGNSNTTAVDGEAMINDYKAGTVGGALGGAAGNAGKQAMKNTVKQSYNKTGIKVTGYSSKKGAQGVAIQQSVTKIVATSQSTATATAATASATLQRMLDNRYKE